MEEIKSLLHAFKIHTSTKLRKIIDENIAKQLRTINDKLHLCSGINHNKKFVRRCFELKITLMMNLSMFSAAAALVLVLVQTEICQTGAWSECWYNIMILLQ